MTAIHHVVTGAGAPPLVFVHGFGCSHSDWDAQVAHFSAAHQTVAVDLRGHGDSPGSGTECSIERYGADVADLMRGLAPSVVVGHSMGCRVAIEAALQAPGNTAGVILVDGSQFAPAMAAVLKARFAEPNGYATMVAGLFKDMFTDRSDPAVAAAARARAQRLARDVGEKMLTDMQRYDAGRLSASLACLRVPVLALQTTYSNEKRERRSLQAEQTTPYLDMVRTQCPDARIAVLPGLGHFPQLDAPAATNALIAGFLAGLSAG